MDARTGRVLWEQNADARLHPASLTKMLTLYIAFDAIRRGEISEDDMVTVTAHAASQPPSRLGLRRGQKISLRHLIRAAAIKSANDAAAAIGDHIGGSPEGFARRMNRTAKALGMGRSSFRNAHGLTAEGHLSTARDMTLLGRRLFYDFPQYYSIFSRLSEDAGVARVNNTNRRFLEAYRGADGIKTGYTVAAGFNLTASAERGNKRLIATVFGGTSTANRNQRISRMLDEGFEIAPNRVRVAPPPAVALAPEAAPAQPQRQARIENSPRPQRRPDAPPATALAEVTNGVASVLASLAEAPAPGTAAAVAAAEAKTEAPAAVSFVDVRPQSRPAQAAAIAPVPAAVPEAPPAELPFQVAETFPDGTIRPPSRRAIDAILEEVARPGEAAPVVPPVQLAEAEMPDELPAPQDDVAEALPAAVPNRGTLVVPKLAEAEADTRPRVRPGDIVMTSAALETAEPENIQRVSSRDVPAGEVVSRVSTSGGRHWAITLGKFNSRGSAERALLQTALSETRMLEGALRKVVERSGGYEATFAGLSRDQAEVACLRLQARAVSCFTLSP